MFLQMFHCVGANHLTFRSELCFFLETRKMFMQNKNQNIFLHEKSIYFYQNVPTISR